MDPFLCFGNCGQLWALINWNTSLHCKRITGGVIRTHCHNYNIRFRSWLQNFNMYTHSDSTPPLAYYKDSDSTVLACFVYVCTDSDFLPSFIYCAILMAIHNGVERGDHCALGSWLWWHNHRSVCVLGGSLWIIRLDLRTPCSDFTTEMCMCTVTSCNRFFTLVWHDRRRCLCAGWNIVDYVLDPGDIITKCVCIGWISASLPCVDWWRQGGSTCWWGMCCAWRGMTLSQWVDSSNWHRLAIRVNLAWVGQLAWTHQ